MSEKKKPSVGEFQQFARALINVQDEARRLGLFKTMHEIDKAIKVSGYEYEKLKP